ncbi:hypothetical protein Q1695_012091 [Nippostrongylus brasiliensis]|nr:hypothetical protein Q1695_012091 [Nippostrongylus brasiliensis]
MKSAAKVTPVPSGTSLGTYQDLLKYRILGDTPEDVIQCEPRWFVFTSANAFKTPSYAEVIITNRDEFKVAWCIKAKEKLVRVSQSHGILKGGESAKLILYLCSCDDWPRDVSEYQGKRIKMVVENLKVPDCISPTNKNEATRMSREIFHYTATNNPLIRMFTKVNIVIKQ